MVRIRLKRLGRKKTPFYRVVVTDVRNRRDGRPLQELGFYNPLSKELKLDKASAEAWIGKGAIPSDTAARLIKLAPETGELIVLEVAKKERLSKKAKAKVEAEAKAAAQAKEQAEAEKAAAKAAAQAAAEAEAAAKAEEANAPVATETEAVEA